MELKEAIKQLPERPGIYFMKNSLGTVIYVGKAKNLKARVSQYFQKNRNNSPKVNEMVEHIDSFEYSITDTELEAFLLECKTIKELKPKYNSQLKNHKGYKYIRISVNEEYPRVLMEPRKKEDGALYFGPYTSESSVLSTIEFIKSYYPIRKCSSGVFKKHTTGCLNYSLGACLGPCSGNDIKDEYLNQVNRIIQFLEGKDVIPIKDLHRKMKSASESLDFEKAAKYRDWIKGVRHVLNKQRIIKVSKYGRNTIAAQELGDDTLKLFLIKGNRLLSAELISLSEYAGSMLEEKLESLIKTHFKAFKKSKQGELSQEDIDEAQIIHSYLKNKQNGIRSINIPASRIEKLNYGKIISVLFPVN